MTKVKIVLTCYTSILTTFCKSIDARFLRMAQEKQSKLVGVLMF